MPRVSEKEKREKLVRYLDRKAFNPILRSSEDDFKGRKLKEEFKNVKKSTESEKERFHNRYKTAKQVKDNYLGDLSSRTAKKKNAELKNLGLPQLPQFRDEFLKLCDKLKVK
jgi:hypothetical protein